jgi:hypothetical protein
MRSSEQAARLLMQGLLEVAGWPEFGDETFLLDVRKRLACVGFELSSSGGYWLARGREIEPIEGFRQLFPLNEAEYAVLAALYLHLRFLPRQSDQRMVTEQPSVAYEDIERAFPAYGVETTRRVLGRLRNLNFVWPHGDRLYAGPYLAAIDDGVADERALRALRDFKLRNYVRSQFVALEEELDASD